MPPAPPQIAGYARVSSKQQADGDSLDNQQHVLRQAGATLLFSDVVSGYSKKARRHAAGFNSLLTAIRSGQVAKLLVKDLTRAARRDVIVHELLEACEAAGIEFLSLQTGRVSTGTAAEWLSVKVVLMFGEYFSRDLSDRIRRGQASYVSRGVPAFSSVTLPWHLQRDPADRHKAIPGPGWADAREAVEHYIAGDWSASEVAAFLYGRHGVMRTTSTVLGWLKGHGIRGHHGRQRGPVLISNCYPALITDEEAQALDRRIEASRWTNGGRRKHTYSLSGITTCHHCGQKLVCSTTRNSSGREYSYVRCNTPNCAAAKHRIPHHQLEDWLVMIRLGPELERIQEHRESAAAIVAPSAELLNQRRRVAALQKLVGEFDSPGVRADLEQALVRLAALEPQPAVRAERSLLQALQIGSDAWWAESSAAQKNTELLAVIEEARVDLTAWPLPPAPPTPAGPCFGEQLEALEPRGRWQRDCALALVPVLQLRD